MVELIFNRAKNTTEKTRKAKIEIVDVQVNSLYIWMAQHLEGVPEVGPGCICAIGDLGQFGFKSVTISDSDNAPNLSKITFDQNLLKVSIKAENYKEMPLLNEALKKLMKADPVVDIYYDEKGDLIIETGGEVHLQRCLKDIEDYTEGIELKVSDPIITFKEAITARYKAKRERKLLKKQKNQIILENERAFEEDKRKDRLRELGAEEEVEEGPEVNANDLSHKKKKTTNENDENNDEVQEEVEDGGDHVGEPNQSEEQAEENDGEEEAAEDQQDLPPEEREYRYFTESSSFFDTTSEEQEEVQVDAVKEAIENWVDSDEEKEDGEDYRYAFQEYNFVYQKKKEEIGNVTKKAKKIKIEKNRFVGLKKKTNSVELKTPNNKYKLSVQAIGMSGELAQFLYSKSKQIKKLFNSNSPKTEAQYVDFFNTLEKKMLEFNTDRVVINLVMRYLISFGPSKIGNNMLLFLFAEPEDTLMGSHLSKEALKKNFEDHFEDLELEEEDGTDKKKSKVKRLSKFDYKNKELMSEWFNEITFDELKKSLLSGFNIATKKGPLSAEEMYGCIFIVEDFKSVALNKKRRQEAREKILGKSSTVKNQSEVKQLEQQDEGINNEENRGDDSFDQTTNLNEELGDQDKKEKSSPAENNDDEKPEAEAVDKVAQPQHLDENIQEVAEEIEDEIEGQEQPPAPIQTNSNENQTEKVETLEKEEMQENPGQKESEAENDSPAPDEEDNPGPSQLVVDPYGPISGQLLSIMKEACLDSFMGAEPRLVQGLFLVTLFCEYEMYGKTCEVINKRRAQILDTNYQDLTNMFIVTAHLPIQESFGFHEEMMINTSGRVIPQLTFHSWEMIEEDPFYEPKTFNVRL